MIDSNGILVSLPPTLWVSSNLQNTAFCSAIKGISSKSESFESICILDVLEPVVHNHSTLISKGKLAICLQVC